MLLQLTRALWGAALLLAPRALLRRVGQPSSGVVQVTRVLGARHLIEALILSRERGRTPPRWTVAVDAVHSASMVALAACSRRLRSDALASAAIAALLATWAEVERQRA
jgi:hypothetical protein